MEISCLDWTDDAEGARWIVGEEGLVGSLGGSVIRAIRLIGVIRGMSVSRIFTCMTAFLLLMLLFFSCFGYFRSSSYYS